LESSKVLEKSLNFIFKTEWEICSFHLQFVSREPTYW